MDEVKNSVRREVLRDRLLRALPQMSEGDIEDMVAYAESIARDSIPKRATLQLVPSCRQ